MSASTNKDTQAELRNREALMLRRRDEDLAFVMNQPAGRRFVQAWLDESGLLDGTFSNQPAEMAWREGRRDFAIQLAKECQRVAPEQFLLMQQEVFEERKTTNQLRAIAEEQSRKDDER